MGFEYPSDVLVDWLSSDDMLSRDRGYVLLDLPTGSGKTYAVADEMADKYLLNRKAACTQRQYYLMTRTHELERVRNLTIAALEKKGVPHAEAEKACLIIPSYESSLMKFFGSLRGKEGTYRLPPACDESLEQGLRDLCDAHRKLVSAQANYEKFLADMKSSNKKKSDMQGYNKTFLDSLKDRIEKLKINFLELERKRFRHLVKSYISDFRSMVSHSEQGNPVPSSAGQAIESLLSNDQYSWIAEMYPAVLWYRASIVFLTYKKAMTTIDTILGDRISILRGTGVQGERFYLDEIDAAKGDIVDALKQEASRPILRDVRKFVYELATQDMEINPWKTIYGIELSEKLAGKLGGIYRKLVKTARHCSDLYNLDREILLVSEDRSNNPFLFYDGSLSSVGSSFVYLINDGTDPMVPQLGDYFHGDSNFVVPKNELSRLKKSLGIEGKLACENSFGNVTREMYYVFSYAGFKIRGIVPSLLDEISRMKPTPRSGKIKGSSTFEIMTTLLCKFVDQSLAFSIASLIERMAFKKRRRKNGSVENIPRFPRRSFLASGFSLTMLNDDNSHMNETLVSSYSIPTTPESILLQLVETNFCIGLSATARHRSVLSNFNWDEIDVVDPSLRVPVPDSVNARLDDAIGNLNRVYDRVNIDVKFAPDISGNKPAGWLVDKLFSHSLPFKEKYDNCCEDGGAFYANRRLMLYAAIDEFLSLDFSEAPCMLAFRNQGADANGELDDFLEPDLAKLCSLHGLSKDDVELVPVMTGTIKDVFGRFENDENHAFKPGSLDSVLKAGKRAIVLACYGSTGEAVDMTLPLLDSCHYVYEHAPSENDRTDIGFVYLECPSHLFPQLDLSGLEENGPSGVTREKAEAALEYLFELDELRAGYELSRSEFDVCANEIERIVTVRPYRRAGELRKLRQLASAQGRGYRRISQAIGRIHRCGVKFGTITIFLDPTIAQSCGFEWNRCIRETPELGAIRKACMESPADLTEPPVKMMANRLSSMTELTHSFMHSAMGSSWRNHGDIEMYERMRETFLAHPTCSRESRDADETGVLRSFYGPVPEGCDSYTAWYSGDFLATEIEFDGIEGTAAPNKFKLRDDVFAFHVAARSFRYEELMSFEPVRDWFIAHGYATEFSPAEFFPSPKLAQMGLGALGEAAFEAVFDFWFSERGYSLRVLPDDVFEKADFQLMRERDGDLIPMDLFFDPKFQSIDHPFKHGVRADERIAEKASLLQGKICAVNVLPPAGYDDIGKLVSSTDRLLGLAVIPWLFDPSTGRENLEGKGAIEQLICQAREWTGPKERS